VTFDALGDRMKGYEDAFRLSFPLRLPVILRVDGRAFHSYTSGLERPFDARFCAAMDAVAQGLCEQIQGAVLAYVQSDEISILLHNYRRLQSQSWFANNVQKMVSVAAGIASTTMTTISPTVFGGIKGAVFDARAFLVPEAEVTNYFLWRQNDATRNSIQMLARSLASHKECHDLGQKELQELCFQRGHNWDDLPTYQKRGRCAIRETFLLDGVPRHRWVIDRDIPIFKGESRDYVERLLALDTEPESAPNRETVSSVKETC
jgi:tRNA(His) 5'-end guanylyltransferase